MLKRRTDLALEAAQLWQESAGEAGTLPGVESEESTREGYPVTTVRIRDEAGARALGKPVGTYVTLELDGLARREEDAFGRAARALAAELGALLGLAPGAPALVVGLGNRAITPDNIGPKAADQTMVTRHLVERVPEHFGSFRPVAALAAGVLGATIMPHVIYLHSSLTQHLHDGSRQQRYAATKWDVAIAMTIAGFVNLAMMATAAAAFHFFRVFRSLPYYLGFTCTMQCFTISNSSSIASCTVSAISCPSRRDRSPSAAISTST